MSFPASSLGAGLGVFFDNTERGCPGNGLCEIYDWTCPCRIDRFLARWRELKESPFLPREHGTLLPLTGALPMYVPMVRHGSRREEVFQSPIVALSTFDVLRKHKGTGYGPQILTAEELRIRFRLRPDAQILLVSVAKDRRIETYWSNRNSDRVPEALSRLSVLGMTIPNYSSFIDAPSIHTAWNLRRMRKVAEELSGVGISVVPHLNARTRGDWEFWTSLLKEQPSIKFVCKEFQTGLHRYEVGVRALGRIVELQRRIGRNLHPILIGGARFTEIAARCFEHFTVVDSMPFMKSVSRKRCVALGGARLGWEEHDLPGGACLDELLEYNHQMYSGIIQSRAALAESMGTAAAQLELPWVH